MKVLLKQSGGKANMDEQLGTVKGYIDEIVCMFDTLVLGPVDSMTNIASGGILFLLVKLLMFAQQILCCIYLLISLLFGPFILALCILGIFRI